MGFEPHTNVTLGTENPEVFKFYVIGKKRYTSVIL